MLLLFIHIEFTGLKLPYEYDTHTHLFHSYSLFFLMTRAPSFFLKN